jgi:uncharacterized protein (TIGR02452 family)
VRLPRLRRLQVQRDVGLHLDRGQPVPDHVVHLLGQPQPLGVDHAALVLGPFPRDRLLHRPAGDAQRERDRHPRRSRDEAGRAGQRPRVGEDVHQQHQQRTAGGDRRRCQRPPAGHRVDADRHRGQHRAVRVAEHQVRRGGGRRHDQRRHRPPAAGRGRRGGDHDQRDREPVGPGVAVVHLHHEGQGHQAGHEQGHGEADLGQAVHARHGSMMDAHAAGTVRPPTYISGSSCDAARSLRRMSGRLREIARVTVEIAEAGGYRSPSGRWVAIDVANAVAGTRLYEPGDTLPTAPSATPEIEVTHESTLQAARRAGGEVAALVFASAKNPGGGFLGGAKAQEEDLARASALYPCLRGASAFYAFHRDQRDLRYSDRVIYSPAVPVFRDDRGALLEEPYPVTFLTAAAPNRGAIARNRPGDERDVPAVVERRAVRVLRVAAAHGHRTLVLGAWGCGVFRNDPAVVANAFAGALRAVDQFDRVIFAIRDDRSGTPVYRAFESAFASPGSVIDDWVVVPDDD